MKAVGRQAHLGLALGVLRGGEHIAQLDAHVGQAAQREVHRGKPHHLRVYIVAEEGGAVQGAHLGGRELVAQAAPLRFAVQLGGGDGAGRRVRQADVVVGRHQKARRAGGRVVDGLADLGVDHLDDGADHMPRRAELAQFAGLFDLPQHVLEEIALGVGVGLVQAQAVDEVDHLGQHGGLVDRQARTGHEVGGAALAQFGEESEHLVADETHDRFARQALGPDRPAEAFARDRGCRAQHGGAAAACILRGEARGGIEGVLQVPGAVEQTGVRLLEKPGAGAVLGVDAFDEIEEEQKRELLGVAHRVRIAAAEQIVADLVDRPAHVGGQGHECSAADGRDALVVMS